VKTFRDLAEGLAPEGVDLLLCHLRVELLDQSVAFACGTLKLLAVQNRDGAVGVLDDALLAQSACGQAHTGTIGAQHRRQKFVRDSQQARTDAVLNQKQPARQPLLQIMQSVTTRRLCRLQSVNGGVAAQQFLQLGTRLERGLQAVDRQLESVSTDLHDGLVRTVADARRDWNRRKPFVPDHANLNAFPVIRVEDQRCHTAVQKVGVFQLLARFVQHGVVRQIEVVQTVPDHGEFFVWNRQQYGVGDGLAFEIRPLARTHDLRFHRLTDYQSVLSQSSLRAHFQIVLRVEMPTEGRRKLLKIMYLRVAPPSRNTGFSLFLCQRAVH
jgi:hypothetical protein